ncbi:MAG: hypothetical protein U0361_08460 [Nitrospiraceae bacterium]
MLHTDATQPKDWERWFRLVYMGGYPPPYYGIGTSKGISTAVGLEGATDAVHSDAVRPSPGAVPHRQMW